MFLQTRANKETLQVILTQCFGKKETSLESAYQARNLQHFPVVTVTTIKQKIFHLKFTIFSHWYCNQLDKQTLTHQFRKLQTEEKESYFTIQ